VAKSTLSQDLGDVLSRYDDDPVSVSQDEIAWIYGDSPEVDGMIDQP
jgi:hypothetical protein